MSLRPAKPLALLAALATAVLLILLPAAPASAALATGWVRLAHLSPDTKQVDVTLSRLAGGTVLLRLSKVGYGGVSKYMALPAGTYAIAMVPAGAPPDSTPVLKAAATVRAGKAETVAVMNLNKRLETHVFQDDLGAPGANAARLRVIQASTKHRDVDVRAGSTLLANGLAFPRASGYTTVAASSTTVTASSGSAKETTTVQLSGGSVHTLFVLDTAGGGLSVTPALDSAAAAIAPSGGMETGGGALAASSSSSPAAAVLAALAATGAAATGALLLRRPRRRAPAGP
jgi:hypothetical protein